MLFVSSPVLSGESSSHLRKECKEPSLKEAVKSVFSSSALLLGAAVYCGYGFGNSTCMSITKNYMGNTLGWTTTMLGNEASVDGAVKICMFISVPLITRCIGDAKTTALGGVLGAVGLVILGFCTPDTIVLVYVGKILAVWVWVGDATILSLVSKCAPKYMRSTILTVVATMAQTGDALAPSVGGWAADNYDAGVFQFLHLDFPGLPFLIAFIPVGIGAILAIGPTQYAFKTALEAKVDRLQTRKEQRVAHEAQLVAASMGST